MPEPASNPESASEAHVSSMLEAVLDQLPIGVILLDDGGRVIRFNRHEEYLSGLERERVLGRSFFSEIAPCTEQIEFETRFREGIAASNLDLDFEFNFPHRFNRVPRDVRIRATSIGAAGPPVHAVLIEDITARAQLERHNVDMLDGLRSIIARSTSGSAAPPTVAATRSVVALSARLAGFAEFAANIEPARLFGEIDRRMRSITELLSRTGAHIDSITGEGVVAWFATGSGQAARAWFEALRAARGIAEHVGPERGSHELDLRFAVGLCAGEIVHGPVGRPEHGNTTTVGRPIAVARALAQVARPTEVLLDEGVAAAVGDTLEAEVIRGLGVPGINNLGTVRRLIDLRLP